MLRGREGKLAAVHFAALSAAGTALCFAVAPAAGWICLSLCALLGAIFAAFTRRRYREIRRLSQYLASVYSGGKPLDIRDNREGELSILKNDLYKITCVLTRQAEQLHRDKDYLAEAMQNISHQLKTPLTSLFPTPNYKVPFCLVNFNCKSWVSAFQPSPSRTLSQAGYHRLPATFPCDCGLLCHSLLPCS